MTSEVLRRPRLWPAAIGSMRRMAAPGWWRHWPPVPLPAPEYLRFRTLTNTGVEGAPSSADVLAFLKWSGSFRGARG